MTLEMTIINGWAASQLVWHAKEPNAGFLLIGYECRLKVNIWNPSLVTVINVSIWVKKYWVGRKTTNKQAKTFSGSRFLLYYAVYSMYWPYSLISCLFSGFAHYIKLRGTCKLTDLIKLKSNRIHFPLSNLFSKFIW